MHLLNELLLIITFGSDWHSVSVARTRLVTDMKCRIALIICLIYFLKATNYWTSFIYLLGLPTIVTIIHA